VTENSELRSSQLAQRVEEIEKLIRSGANVTGTSLASMLETAQARLDSQRVEEEHATHEKKEREQQERVAVAHMVEREHRLNAAEKEQYGRFLEQDYFTKANFDELDRFYARSWDKLSDEGKAEMSHRVWEGIRRDEYEFDELPENVRKKEAERLYQQISGQTTADERLKNIPERDKQDFIREYKAGNDKGVSEVLNRENFAENVSSRKESSPEGSPSNEKNAEEQERASDKKQGEEKKIGLDVLALSGVVLGETESVTKPEVPAVGASQSHGKG
jgi:hypothetical protein